MTIEDMMTRYREEIAADLANRKDEISALRETLARTEVALTECRAENAKLLAAAQRGAGEYFDPGSGKMISLPMASSLWIRIQSDCREKERELSNTVTRTRERIKNLEWAVADLVDGLAQADRAINAPEAPPAAGTQTDLAIGDRSDAASTVGAENGWPPIT